MAFENISPHKSTFLQACLDGKVLSFGTYKLKSGRESPYFFNAGLFLDNASLFRSVQTAYAQCIIAYANAHPEFSFDVLFGLQSSDADYEFLKPAYKGIPLAAATFGELARLEPKKFGHVGCSFNRKEVKDHGDGGSLIGASLRGKRVMIIDDVLTAGTAIREAIEIIKAEGGKLAGVIIALDRMERMRAEGGGSAINEVEKLYGVPVLTIIDLNDLIKLLEGEEKGEDIRRIKEYKERYGVTE